MKWIIRIVIVLMLVVMVLGVVGYVMLDKLTKKGIERGGTYAMGVETKLDGIHIGLLSGSVSMNGLSVANPEGFKADHFMSLREGNVDVALTSLMGDKVEVALIKLCAASDEGRSEERWLPTRTIGIGVSRTMYVSAAAVWCIVSVPWPM